MNKNNLMLKWEELSDIEYYPAENNNKNEKEVCPVIVMFTPQASTAHHSHDFYEFVYVQEGFCLHFINEKFKKATGFTPSEYLHRRRFAKALELLHTNKPVGDVAHETGFKQINYFSREFKKLFNMTPTEFQKQCRNYK